MYVYDNLLDALNDLHKRGFIFDFNRHFNEPEQERELNLLKSLRLEIVEHYRFEANTNPADSSVLYAIQSQENGLKGVLINAYGAYSEAGSDKLIQQLMMHEEMLNSF